VCSNFSIYNRYRNSSTAMKPRPRLISGACVLLVSVMVVLEGCGSAEPDPAEEWTSIKPNEVVGITEMPPPPEQLEEFVSILPKKELDHVQALDGVAKLDAIENLLEKSCKQTTNWTVNGEAHSAILCCTDEGKGKIPTLLADKGELQRGTFNEVGCCAGGPIGCMFDCVGTWNCKLLPPGSEQDDCKKRCAGVPLLPFDPPPIEYAGCDANKAWTGKEGEAWCHAVDGELPIQHLKQGQECKAACNKQPGRTGNSHNVKWELMRDGQAAEGWVPEEHWAHSFCDKGQFRFAMSGADHSLQVRFHCVDDAQLAAPASNPPDSNRVKVFFFAAGFLVASFAAYVFLSNRNRYRQVRLLE